MGFGYACRAVGRFIAAEFRELSGVVAVVLGLVVAATLVSALAWYGVGLIAFVPLVGGDPNKALAQIFGAHRSQRRMRSPR